MNNKMLHRGSMTRLTSTETKLPVLSTCILLLIQFQTFHALPTSSPSILTINHQQDIGTNIRASSHSTAYGSAYPYSSYRPGARLDDSYRPYSAPQKESDSSSSSGLYATEALHPNSVYSQQSSSSSLSQNLDKVLELIEKEITSDLQQQQQNDKQIPFTVNTNNDGTPEEKKISLSLSNNNTPTSNNKPRLRPLPAVQSSSSSATYETNNGRKQQQNINDNEQQPQQQQPAAATSTFGNTRSALRAEKIPEFSPFPPPFAPELDPQYERRQYGLGGLTLLDQAGPFW